MEENYINIFTTFLAKLLEKEQITLDDTVALVTVFKPISAMVQKREQLVYFLDKYMHEYPQLGELKVKLLDKDYKFK